MFYSCLSIYSRCCLGATKVAKIILASIYAYRGAPRSVCAVPMNPFVARLVVRLWRSIGHILLVGRFAQVVPTIVRGVQIFVVNLILRPLARDDQPDDVGRLKYLPRWRAVADDDVIFWASATSDVAGPHFRVFAADLPSEQPGVGIIAPRSSGNFGIQTISFFRWSRARHRSPSLLPPQQPSYA